MPAPLVHGRGAHVGTAEDEDGDNVRTRGCPQPWGSTATTWEGIIIGGTVGGVPGAIVGGIVGIIVGVVIADVLTDAIDHVFFADKTKKENIHDSGLEGVTDEEVNVT